MSIKVVKEAWEIENNIKNLNKKDLVEYMLGYLKNAEAFTNDNRNTVYHHMNKIKQKIESTEVDLRILEFVGIKDKEMKEKQVGKKYVLESLEKVKNRIESLYNIEEKTLLKNKNEKICVLTMLEISVIQHALYTLQDTENNKYQREIEKLLEKILIIKEKK